MTASDILVAFTLAGDSDLDGDVDFADLVKVAQNYGATNGKFWSEGNFNYDANVDFADLVTVAQNYGTAFPAEPIPGVSPEFAADVAIAFAQVPEPTFMGLAAWGSMMLQRRRSGVFR